MSALDTLIIRALDELNQLAKATNDLRGEFAALRKLGRGEVAWSTHRTLTVAAGARKSFDLLKEFKGVAVSAIVTSAGTTGTYVAFNGSEAFETYTGDTFDRARIASVLVDNAASSSEAKIVVFLATTQEA